MKRPVLLSIALLLAAPACTGSIGDSLPGGSSGPGAPASGQPGPGGQPAPGAPGAPSTGSPAQPGNPSMTAAPTMPGKPGDDPIATKPADPNTAGPLPLRRLTKREYNNTVRDLLGDASNPADAFPPDRDSDFHFKRSGLVAQVDAQRLAGAAETLATAAEARFAMLVPCTPAAPTDEEACAKKFIESFGLRAYRRPLDGGEVDRLLKLYREGRGPAQLDWKGGIRLLIEAMLQSPNFVYRWETDPTAAVREGNVVRLGPYQVASRLSYAVWGSMPDQTLFDAAASNKLSTEADIDAQVTRMLADNRAKDQLIAFFEEWFGFDELAERPKDAKLYPEWKDDLKAAMIAELRAFLTHVIFEGDGKLDTLLGAKFSFVNQPLAAVYGMTGVTGPALKRAELDPTQRAGLLTLSGWLTLTGGDDGSHPIQRGKMVFERLLCGVLPPPPPDVPPPKAPAPGLTTRERFNEHGQNSCAIGCHQFIDPLGFAFEHYDGLGKFREVDAGKPVDATGSIKLDGSAKSFANARELTKLLADSAEARRCFVTQVSRFALSRHETEADRASLQAAFTAFEADGHSVKSLLGAIAKTRSFRYRTPASDEALR